MSLRIGIIGCGGIGRTHFNAWSQAGYTPVALADTVPGAATTLAGSSGAQAYTDIATFLAEAKLDIVSICTPPSTHRELVVSALAAGVHVLCEKPLAPTVADCEAMIAAASAANKLLSVGFCHRFQPHIETMKQMIDSGTIGEVIMFRNRFAGHMANVESKWFSDPALAGGGVMMDTSVHSVDLFRHLIGDAVSIQASAVTRTTELGPALRVEDTSVILLTSADGVIGTIEASWRTPPGEWIVTVYGTRGSLNMDYDTMQLWHTDATGQRQQVTVADGDRFVNEMAHVAQCVNGEAQLRVTGADGLAATYMLTTAAERARG
jgi:predicted dehydrogenase